MEIIDAQFHEPASPKPLPDDWTADARRLLNVELAREALDCVGVDKAIAFADQPYIDACVERYPERFAGVLTFDHTAADLEEQIATYRDTPGNLAGRNSVGNADTAELRPEFAAGAYDRYWELAERYELPLFFSTHGWPSVMEVVAQRHPGMTIIIDHLGLSQSPVSPPRADPWDALDGLLALARYPNVYVKLCGVALLSREPAPHRDAWPHLHRVFDAFGPERIMWASDYTRMRWLPSFEAGPDVRYTAGDEPTLAPFKQWTYYSDCLNYLRDTDELSTSDKEWVLGRTVRRALRWES